MCLQPKEVTKRGQTFRVGCGKCGECISRRRMEWRQRLYFENKGADRLYFCTFTYNDAHLPRCLGFAVPKVEDVQKFHKRLRRYIQYHKLDISFKYFVCSEYGPKHFRPHYHGLYCVSGRHTLRFPKIVRIVYNYGFCDVSLCRNRDASTSYITNYLTQTKGNPYFGQLPNAKYPSSYLTRLRWTDKHCYSNRCFDTFYLYSKCIGQKYFQSQIAPIILHNLRAFLKECKDKKYNIVRIIKHFSRTTRHIIGNLRVTVMESSLGNQKLHFGLDVIAARNSRSETLVLFFGIHMANTSILAARQLAREEKA